MCGLDDRRGARCRCHDLRLQRGTTPLRRGTTCIQQAGDDKLRRVDALILFYEQRVRACGPLCDHRWRLPRDAAYKHLPRTSYYFYLFKTDNIWVIASCVRTGVTLPLPATPFPFWHSLFFIRIFVVRRDGSICVYALWLWHGAWKNLLPHLPPPLRAFYLYPHCLSQLNKSSNNSLENGEDILF